MAKLYVSASVFWCGEYVECKKDFVAKGYLGKYHLIMVGYKQAFYSGSSKYVYGKTTEWKTKSTMKPYRQTACIPL